MRRSTFRHASSEFPRLAPLRLAALVRALSLHASQHGRSTPDGEMVQAVNPKNQVDRIQETIHHCRHPAHADQFSSDVPWLKRYDKTCRSDAHIQHADDY